MASISEFVSLMASEGVSVVPSEGKAISSGAVEADSPLGSSIEVGILFSSPTSVGGELREEDRDGLEEADREDGDIVIRSQPSSIGCCRLEIYYKKIEIETRTIPVYRTMEQAPLDSVGVFRSNKRL